MVNPYRRQQYFHEFFNPQKSAILDFLLISISKKMRYDGHEFVDKKQFFAVFTHPTHCDRMRF
jgi:hypothetical protein